MGHSAPGGWIPGGSAGATRPFLSGAQAVARSPLDAAPRALQAHVDVWDREDHRGRPQLDRLDRDLVPLRDAVHPHALGLVLPQPAHGAGEAFLCVLLRDRDPSCIPHPCARLARAGGCSLPAGHAAAGDHSDRELHLLQLPHHLHILHPPGPRRHPLVLPAGRAVSSSAGVRVGPGDGEVAGAGGARGRRRQQAAEPRQPRGRGHLPAVGPHRRGIPWARPARGQLQQQRQHRRQRQRQQWLGREPRGGRRSCQTCGSMGRGCRRGGEPGLR
mmetsp:Transcript_10025/g.29948  ORF Transcript_10025/g.29948 Transcript_10025/m.29948 type:complete len:273 (-) Transcript_10025:1385-2203(-)